MGYMSPPVGSRFESTKYRPIIESPNFISSPYADIDLPDNLPLHDYMLSQFSKYGDTIALVDGITGSEISYATLQTMIVKVASALVSMGFGEGDVATLCSANCPEYVVMFLAIGATGGTVSTVNPAYTSEELGKAINQVRSKVLIISSELLGNAQNISQRCPSVKETIVFGKSEGFRSFSDLLENDMSLFPEKLDINCKERNLVIPFSSGTTGLPKGVMLTHHNILSNILQTSTPNVMQYHGEGISILSVLPFFHIYGQVSVSLLGLAAGTKMVILPKFDPVLYMNCVQKYKINILQVVPPLMLFLGKHPLVSKFDFSSVLEIVTGAAPCGADTMREVEERFTQKITVRQGYGLTEASPLTHCNSPYENKQNTCGTAIPNTQFKVVEIETGKTLDKNENGELLVRGPQVMKGYFENEKATSEAIIDGWLHTGDIGHYDEDGHVIIVDRFKELIKVKGLQVAPAELEALLVTHEFVADAAVIGKPDERLGEAPVAFVVLKANYKPSDEVANQLKAFIAERVAPYKVLAGGVEFRSEIPKAASGKILRRVLKAEL